MITALFCSVLINFPEPPKSEWFTTRQKYIMRERETPSETLIREYGKLDRKYNVKTFVYKKEGTSNANR